MKIDYDEAREELEGFMQGNAMASFVHLHFGSNPTVAPAFVECCRYLSIYLSMGKHFHLLALQDIG